MLETSNTPPVVFGRRAVVPEAGESAAQDDGAAPPRRKWLRPWQSSVIFCLLGFLAGAPFWHLIGFWGYLTATVPGSQQADKTRSIQEAAAPRDVRPAASPARATQPGLKAPPAALVMNNCTALVLDRTTGATLLAACKAQAPILAEGSLKLRGDLLAAAWPQQTDVADTARDGSASPWHITVIDAQGPSGRAN